MRRFLLLALSLVASPAAAAVPSGCQEDYVTCKEDCTIEYGGSSRAISQLTRCIAQCQQTLDSCAQKHSSLKIPTGAANERAREGGDPYADSDSEPRRSGKVAPAVEAAPKRQGVYRASESETAEEAAPAPKPKAAAAPAPEPDEGEGLAPMDDVPEPAPKAKAVAKPAPKSEPKKEPAPLVTASEDEKDPLLDEEPPPPPPENKVAPVAKPSRPETPPEPKKKDISEWDPDGD